MTINLKLNEWKGIPRLGAGACMKLLIVPLSAITLMLALLSVGVLADNYSLDTFGFLEINQSDVNSTYSPYNWQNQTNSTYNADCENADYVSTYYVWCGF